ncbi:MAG: adenylyl-sulfate reductase subunit alpha, partial [Lachnospiraceae bacterium]|nr:adenylyl-sulfate reductase subunit alpha [Lachnospiraceae bacterium]
MSKDIEVRRIKTDVLIIGGGTAGCYAALTLSRDTELSVVIAEKAHIKRSGCLAAGVNAINAYITKGHVPQDYVDYAKKDAAGIVREDLLLTAAEHFNEVTADMEQLGLVILKDENGDYVTRGNRNIKINGENFKPILAQAVQAQENVSVLNRVNITKLLTKDETVYGAVGFSLEDETAYVIEAKAVLVATGGAAGLYKPNNPGFSRHKMWYPPFNTGAGYAMGIQAGAEMTSFEMRFIALRCKDTIAPTGTIAQGVGAKQVNSRGFIYEDKYGLTTSERVYGTVRENQLGNGPCYLKTSGIDKEQEENLLKAYLNMAPSQTLKWIETGELPGEQDVEIEGTEPYIVGGHTASGYWVDTNRETTIHGLYAAGDVAGGCPQKYVTGALAEGELAAKAIEAQLAGNVKASEEEDLKGSDPAPEKIEKYLENLAGQEIDAYKHILSEHISSFTAEELEEAMQKVMDEYAGGIRTAYRYNARQLALAGERIGLLTDLAGQLRAEDMDDLVHIFELRERLVVCQSLIAHLLDRKETRWPGFGVNTDYPEKDEACEYYVNSKLVDGKIQVF